ncbi:MAG: ATP-dependent DNA helicase RecG [Candidatus Kapaibacteriales bacterium]
MSDIDNPLTLNTELKYLPGIGPFREKFFQKSGSFTAGDLLFFKPIGYINREKVSGFSTAVDGSYKSTLGNTEISLIAKVGSSNERRLKGNRSMLSVSLLDLQNKKASAVFFNRTGYHKKALTKDKFYVFTGKPEKNKYGLQIVHPRYTPATQAMIESELSDSQSDVSSTSNDIIPKYSLSEQMLKSGITGAYIVKLMRYLHDKLLSQLKDQVPSTLLAKRDIPKLSYCIRNLHFPDSYEVLEKVLFRFKYEEMLRFQLALRYKSLNAIVGTGVPIRSKSESARKVYDSLPFELTSDQKKVLREIASDLSSGRPMSRLLQGDVGAGKTIVALLTMLMAKDSGYQTVLLAPTEVLAEQHYKTITKLLSITDTRTELLTGSTTAKRSAGILTSIANGSTDIVVGTHSLFQDRLKYHSLGLVVIDEQHRFGVEQRALIRELGSESLSKHTGEENQTYPHILLMSATPIPRTISLSIYGDLDLSFIKTKPANRKPIVTKALRKKDINEVYESVKSEIRNGNQAFFIYPLVEESEESDLKSVEEAYEELKKVFGHQRVCMVHGKMHSKDKDATMTDFKSKKYDVMVATTVIEVGIDIPDATVMVINHAERFGLSQLHQLRGRVGRSEKQSYCYLISKASIDSKSQLKIGLDLDISNSNARLEAMLTSDDGFYIAEKDLEIRGPGDIIGVRQSGMPNFKYIDLMSDLEVIEMAKVDANELVSNYSEEHYMELIEGSGVNFFTDIA